MTTLKEMCDVIDSIPIDEAEGIPPFPLSESWYYLRCLMYNAENNRRRYNDGYGEHNIPCTFWIVGDYIIIYLTNNWEFHAGMLTEEMMYDLIIEEG